MSYVVELRHGNELYYFSEIGGSGEAMGENWGHKDIAYFETKAEAEIAKRGVIQCDQQSHDHIGDPSEWSYRVVEVHK